MFKYSGSEFRVYKYSGSVFKTSRSGIICLSSLHEEMNKANSTEPTGTTTSSTVVQNRRYL